MPSQKPFVLPSLWFGPAYVWFMLFRAHSRPSSERACLGLPWKIYVRKFHADGIRWFNTLDNLKQFIVEPRRPLRLASRTRPKTNKHGKFYGSGSAVGDGGRRAWQDKSCIFIILFYCAYIFKYVCLPCSDDLFLFPHLFCHLVAKEGWAEGSGGVCLMWHGGLSLGIDVSFGVIKITKISFAFLGWLCAIESGSMVHGPQSPVLSPRFRVPGPRSFR